ncbi:hypothetical protein [Acidomonas methanolica]|uniref:Uncharacterized protein n=1 Tax=Acidomonas methanolica NBRC 104435 TaxID=1231351 RepID=A0A023D5S6_ACIMT|nr:hypothetical protein [Acidomonas methanolica]MBU2652931.1 hypothetical protein [Acidomonas methanolica]TCS31334.1 hypothetical protein EDC31_103177 [Acidomonas methanolica]GAJ29513.1 hypothetical protein Amme_064_007 [Acidomonas methanolica NBRC 104435]GBQ48239.1 hypothetical protein AA0498_0714 [Acidomonas methanolica]GEK98418.1 hypothetical protein AME01nite_09170 [Acidomonas methanolica NBRC 104435]
MLSTSLPWNRGTASPRPRPDPITEVNPLKPIDRTNEWLKDNTYVDMFGWKDVVSDGRSAVKQVMLLGIMGDAYLARTRAGKETVIFRGRPGLRARLPGTRYLREHPIVKEAGFVIGRKEALEEAGRAVRIAATCFVAWDIAHELLQDKPSMTRLGVSIVSDIFQAVAATYIGWAVGTGFAMVFSGGIVMTFAYVATATFASGWLLSYLDNNLKLTQIAVEKAKSIENSDAISGFVKFSERLGGIYVKRLSRPLAGISCP